MKKFFKENWKFLLLVLLGGLIGGYCVGLYNYDSLSEELLKQIKEIKLQKDIVDPDDVEMLQDLIMSAVNEAMRKADDSMNSEMSKFNIPGLF